MTRVLARRERSGARDARSDDPDLELRREDVYDRRWARHRDQLLTAVGVSSVVLAAVLGMPVLGAVAALAAGPRAARWVFGEAT